MREIARRRQYNEGVQVLFRPLAVILTAAVVTVGGGWSATLRANEYEEGQFKGKIAANAKDSMPDWREAFSVPKGAPNILLILLDDVGFADTSTFGGFAQTPVLDRLAAEGLRYNQFHTAAICSPTRAALLSGRNQHRIGYGSFGGVGYPGYDGIWKKNAVSVAELLRRNGYSTAAFGKWHNTPFQEISPIGPFDRWPTGLGFEYFYGNLLGMSSQWEPELWRNTQMVAPPATAEQGYHFTTDITDEAIRWLHTHESLAPEQPYFLYFATEAAHLPHHVPKEWIEKYRGRFDQGWDQLREEIFARQKRLGVIPATADLTPRPKELPAWNTLSADAKRLFARQMEVYAAYVAQTDHEIGRLIQVVKDGPNAANTLILYIVGDNGTESVGGVNGTDNLSAYVGDKNDPVADQLKHIDQLGGPQFENLYAAGWAWMGSTPFQWVKHVASHFGGTRNPLVVSWPARIKDHGGVRSQFSYVTDVAPTLYEAAGIEFPEVVDGVKQLALDGVSLLEGFDRAEAPSRHRVQYFEAEGNRGIYHDGWIAAARHFIPWVVSKENTGILPSDADFGRDHWELYHVAEDFSEAHDVAARYPDKLKALQALFDSEARQNNVYPLGAGTIIRPPVWLKGRGTFVLYPGFPSIYTAYLGGPDLARVRRLTAELVIPDSGASGALVAEGSRLGGVVLYVKDNRVVYENNVGGKIRESLISSMPLQRGKSKVVFEMDREGTTASPNIVGRLYVNGQRAGERELTPNTALGVFDIGKNTVSPISDAYQPPFKFTGEIESLTLELK